MTLSGHTDVVERCFFEENSLDLMTISRSGQVFYWESNLDVSDLIPENQSENTSKRQVLIPFKTTILFLISQINRKLQRKMMRKIQ